MKRMRAELVAWFKVPGDIVMLRYPADPDKSFVKRMIAQEGDSVRIVNGEVYVNGHIIPERYVAGDHRECSTTMVAAIGGDTILNW